MHQPIPTTRPGGRELTDKTLPRPVLVFACVIGLLVLIKVVIGAGANKPDQVAMAVGDGLMSIFRDDESLKNMTLIFTKDGKNNDGTAELRGVGAGLGSLFFGGNPRIGGKLYFNQYTYESGVVLNGGPLDIELTNAGDGREKASHFRVQGIVKIAGNDQPAQVQIDFISPEKSYNVTQLSGTINLNGTVTTIQP